MTKITYTPEDEAEHMGFRMGNDLIRELFTFKQIDAPQVCALGALHDKLRILSKLEPFDNAAGGFAVALVNLLEIGVENLPMLDDEE